jgi:sugar/nucleoside kinase (ribokinase family)
MSLIKHDLDYVIGNEAELRSLFETDDIEEAIAKTTEICPIVVCTRSGDGVTLVREGERVDVPVKKVVPVDATGAGDQFAAGFLYGLSKGHDLETCGKMGNLCAAEVISHIGPRPQKDMLAEFKAAGLV